MPRKPRVQFPNAIYHIVTRGDGKQKLFHDEGHYQRFTEGLQAEVLRSGWQVIAYCWMPNHIHALIKTPEPNLSNGMQHWLSGYANWYAKRNRRTGHLYQGRFKAFQVEDSSYFWPLSRYIHLNPCVGQKPLVEKAEAWIHSSYGHYIDRRRRQDWLASDLLLDSWQAEYGGPNPVSAYRRYVEQELEVRSGNPLKSALEDWVIGSEAFLQKIVKLAALTGRRKSLSKRHSGFTPEWIISQVASHFGKTPDDYFGFRCRSEGREIAALLCRELTGVSLADLSTAFGLTHPDSAANLAKKAKRLVGECKKYRDNYHRIKQTLFKTENQV
ncbi:MAG TPA: transposase [Pirellulaceae bacterium]|nr:transposase [Pirellulaceae bacterium]